MLRPHPLLTLAVILPLVLGMAKPSPIPRPKQVTPVNRRPSAKPATAAHTARTFTTTAAATATATAHPTPSPKASPSPRPSQAPRPRQSVRPSQAPSVLSSQSDPALPPIVALRKVDAVDPTAQSNPMGAPFPGFRGGDQLVVYEHGSTSGTNEFGFEVTVVGSRVVQRDGADSQIPAGGFVISGHGKARTWILQNLPVGTRVTWDKAASTLEAVQDPEATVWRVRAAWATLSRLAPHPDTSLGRSVVQLDDLVTARPQEAVERASVLLAELQQAIARAYQPLPTTARAVWYRPLEKDETGVAAIVAKAKAAGIQTIYLESLYHGYPIYPSDTFRHWHLPAQYPRYAGWDPLAAYIRAGAAQGVTIVPWIHTLYVGHDSLKPACPILATYPDWTNRQMAGATEKRIVASSVEGGAYFLDPAHPEVRQFLGQVVGEITRRYPVKAVQLDDTRYPMPFPEAHPSYLASTWGYTRTARAGFRRAYGQDPVTLIPGTPAWSSWTAYRERQLTDVVRVMHDAIKQARPDVAVQVPFATNPFESRDRTLQDWEGWADKNLVDALAVLNYTNSVAAIRRNVRYTHLATAGEVTVIGGVFGPFLAATPLETLAQIAAARESGADVIGLFSLQQVDKDTGNALQAGVFAPDGDVPATAR